MKSNSTVHYIITLQDPPVSCKDPWNLICSWHECSCFCVSKKWKIIKLWKMCAFHKLWARGIGVWILIRFQRWFCLNILTWGDVRYGNLTAHFVCNNGPAVAYSMCSSWKFICLGTSKLFFIDILSFLKILSVIRNNPHTLRKEKRY